MRVRTDDEIYRIDAVWLGPPRATFPWRATYASYLLGFLIFISVLFVQRRLGIAFNIFPTAWAVVITVFLTRVISRKVNYEKGVVQLFEHFWAEVTGPRERTDRRWTVMRSNHVRVRPEPMSSVRRVTQRTASGRPSPHTVPGPVGGPFGPTDDPAGGSAGGPAGGSAPGRQSSRMRPVPYRGPGAGAATGSVSKAAARPSRRPKLRPTRPGGS